MSIIVFDTIQYLSDIMNSYDNNISKLYNQYTIDYKRSSIYNNGTKINSIIPLIYKLSNICIINNLSFHLSDILISLCTQAAHAFSFITVNDIFKNIHDNAALCSYRTSFDIKNNVIFVNSYFLLKDINTSKIINNINAQLRLYINQNMFNEKGILIITIK